MSAEIVVPEFGESVVEATVGHWLKAEGDAVQAGEAVVELETEKVNTEVAAAEGGVLSQILHKEGDTVRPGDVLGVVAGGASAPAGAPSEQQPAEPAPPAHVAAPAGPTPGADGAVTPEAAEETEKARVSPAAQRLASELSVDLSRVHGTGPSGRIMRDDVEAAVRQERQAVQAVVPPAPAPAVPPAPAAPQPSSQVRRAAPELSTSGSRPETRERLSRRRLTIARRLVEVQQTTAMLTTFNEIDMSAVMELRKRRREAFKQTTGADLGFMSFFVKASVGALKAFPQLNSELQGDELVLKHFYDIGIAIGDPEGLVVPVLRDADKMSFAQIETAISDYVQKARDKTLSMDELRGGTFTITNGGVFGSMMSTPMLNPPQVGILGMHKIVERPVVVDGQIVIRPIMYVALSYDHRVADGREAVQFLFRIKQLVEDPERLLLEG